MCLPYTLIFYQLQTAYCESEPCGIVKHGVVAVSVQASCPDMLMCSHVGNTRNPRPRNLHHSLSSHHSFHPVSRLGCAFIPPYWHMKIRGYHTLPRPCSAPPFPPSSPAIGPSSTYTLCMVYGSNTTRDEGKSVSQSYLTLVV